jgi:sigma-E factor negative regulatory protein RseA
MADNLDEKVSALVDGELPREEVDQLIMALKQDSGIQACWRHFHLISDALKNNLPDRLPEDFVKRVSLALESEPALTNPPPPYRSARPTNLHAPTVGFALAASVAAVAFLGLGWHSLNPTEPAPESAVVAQAASDAVAPAPSMPTAVTTVSTLPAISYTKVHGRQWDVERPDVISKLNGYLISHDQYSLVGVRSGVLPQVRIVGYERVEGVQPDFAGTAGEQQ